jgi:phage terminase small subunit
MSAWGESQQSDKPRPGGEVNRHKFVEAYVRESGDLRQAAAESGYSYGHARNMMTMPRVKGDIAECAKAIAIAEHITTREWAENLAAIAFIDPADVFNEADEALPVRAMPVRVRKAIKSVRVVKRVLTREGGDEIVETATHVEFWDKNSALITMAKHLGLFERDNSQQKEPIRVTVELVG